MDDNDGELESPTLAGAGNRRILFRFSIPISALAAVVMIAGTILLVRPVRKSQVKEVVQTAQVSLPPRSDSDLRAPAPQYEKMAAPTLQTPRKEASGVAPVLPAPPAESKEKKALTKTEGAKLAAVTPPPAQLPGEPMTPAAVREPAQMREIQNQAQQNAANLQQTTNAQFRAAPATGGAVGGVVGKGGAMQDAAAPKPVEPVESFLRLDRDAQEQLPRLTLFDRSFYQWKGYWVDGKCLENPGAPVVEISRTDAEFSELAQQLQDLKGAPVVVFRLNRILVVR
jgi:hypothetical protein